MTRAIVTLGLLVAPLAAMANCEGEAALRRVVSQNPTKMANDAVSRNDLRFLGVAGYSVMVPGLDGPKCTALRSVVRVLEGTSDTPCDVKLQEKAREFARSYNTVIKAQLDAKSVKYETCAP